MSEQSKPWIFGGIGGAFATLLAVWGLAGLNFGNDSSESVLSVAPETGSTNTASQISLTEDGWRNSPLNRETAVSPDKQFFVCTAQSMASIYEDFAQQKVVTDAGKGSDVLSIKIDGANANEVGKLGTIQAISGADVTFGVGDETVYDIITLNAMYVVGVWTNSTHTDVHTLVFDKIYGNLLWSRSGQHFLGGMRGDTTYMVCE